MEGSYRIDFVPVAERQARRLPKRDARRVRTDIRALAHEPRPLACKKLAGLPATWRVKSGRYRVIYEIDDTERRVLVLRVAKRDEGTYRGL